MTATTRAPRRILDVGEVAAATFLGITIALSISTVFLVIHEIDASPLPVPMAVAFVVRLFGEGTLSAHALLPVGLAFHVLYVTTATAAAVVVFNGRLGAQRAVLTALLLWLGAGVVFMPIVGWGLFGLGIGIGAAAFVAGIHALYALLLWAGTWAVFGRGEAAGSA